MDWIHFDCALQAFSEVCGSGRRTDWMSERRACWWITDVDLKLREKAWEDDDE